MKEFFKFLRYILLFNAVSMYGTAIGVPNTEHTIAISLLAIMMILAPSGHHL